MKNTAPVTAALLAASLLLPGTALAQAKRHAIEACVSQIDNDLEDKGVRVSITLASGGSPFRLTPQGFTRRAEQGPVLTLAQIAQWSFLLEQLRDAGKGKFPVRFELDSAGRNVEYVRVLFYKPC